MGSFRKHIVSSIVAAMLLAGCGGGWGSSSGAVGAGGAGGGAKGPFKEGSSVIAYQLDANGSRSATTKNTLTTDARGHFSFGTSLSWTGATEFVICKKWSKSDTNAVLVRTLVPFLIGQWCWWLFGQFRVKNSM